MSILLDQTQRHKQYTSETATQSIQNVVGDNDLYSVEAAKLLDDADPIKHARSEFCIPRHHNSDLIYFCGNSLGLLSHKSKQYVTEEMQKWEQVGVEGHFTGERPWAKIDEGVTQLSTHIVGAKHSEVAILNSLSVNLHLLMLSFYTPTTQRYKILIEEAAFCSDHHIVRSQINLHGLNVDDALIQVKGHDGKHDFISVKLEMFVPYVINCLV